MSDCLCTCPCCDKTEFLGYRIRQDEYVCAECGLVSTANEAVAHGRELQLKEEKAIDHWIEHYTEADGRQGAD